MKIHKTIEVRVYSILILAFCAILSTEARTVIHNPLPGGLCRVLSPAQADTCTVLVVTGNLNSADIHLFRRMAGYAEHEGERTGCLTYLDLSGARLVSDKEPYLTVDAEQARLCLFQRLEFTSDLTDHIRKGGPPGFAAVSGYGGGDSWSYWKNYAMLNFCGRRGLSKPPFLSDYGRNEGKSYFQKYASYKRTPSQESRWSVAMEFPHP